MFDAMTALAALSLLLVFIWLVLDSAIRGEPHGDHAHNCY